MQKAHALVLVLLAPFLVAASGCIALAAGGAAAGGTAYVMGELKVPVEASPERLQSAIRAAGEDLSLRKIQESADGLSGKFVYRTGDDRKITIRYEEEGKDMLEMKIRVGTFGDQSMSMRINDAIQGHL